ncbi:MAG: YkgJ family cysteine cluster protein [Anaerolineales bacterium]|nr:YkgJ family cysteine cluster protein [Anaerolineales bacterium]
MENQNSFPINFDENACKTCGGNCCRGFTGYVWISREELENVAEARKMDLASFSKQYVRQVKDRLSLQERHINGEHFCCFFDPIECQCTIYQNRPDQCRTFPYWNQYKIDFQELLLECPGVSLR